MYLNQIKFIAVDRKQFPPGEEEEEVASSDDETLEMEAKEEERTI
jgi:hypothetical protein